MARKRRLKRANLGARFSNYSKYWIGGLLVLALLGVGNWFAHLPTARRASFGSFEPTLEALGAVTADATDAIGLTGRDVAVEYLAPLSKGPLPFGLPQIVNTQKVPKDIQVLKRKGYWVGFSPTLGYPVWSAYAIPVKRVMKWPPERPAFLQDKQVFDSPTPDVYTGSGYDRGHMAPNYAIATGYGRIAQRETFLMTNIAPQRPDLNRGPWRILEQKLADELSSIGDTVYVLVCTVPDASGAWLKKGRVRIPKGFAMIVAAVHDRQLRVFGIYMPQETASSKRPRYCFCSVRALEEATGLNFFPNLSPTLQDAVEIPEANRFWPRWEVF